MRNVTPLRKSPIRKVCTALFFVVGFIYAIWELRMIWRELASAIHKLKKH